MLRVGGTAHTCWGGDRRYIAPPIRLRTLRALAKLKVGWHAHKLNAPRKFLISAPEHDTPRRARAYLVTDDDVTATVTRYAATRPRLTSVSHRALSEGSPPQPSGEPSPDYRVGSPSAADEKHDPDAILKHALSAAPAEKDPGGQALSRAAGLLSGQAGPTAPGASGERGGALSTRMSKG